MKDNAVRIADKKRHSVVNVPGVKTDFTRTVTAAKKQKEQKKKMFSGSIAY